MYTIFISIVKGVAASIRGDATTQRHERTDVLREDDISVWRQ